MPSRRNKRRKSKANSSKKTSSSTPKVKINIKPHLYKAAMPVMEAIKREKHSVFVIGGTVRDMFLGGKPTDTDIATTMTVDEIKAFIAGNPLLFGSKPHVISNRFSPCVRVKNTPLGFDVDISSLCMVWVRERHKSRNRWLDRLKEAGNQSVLRSMLSSGDEASINKALWTDAVRRDFSMNALYIDPFELKVYDPTGKGIEDIKARRLRFNYLPTRLVANVYNVDVSSADRPGDFAWLLRGVRISSRLKLTLEAETKKAFLALSTDFGGVICPKKMFREVRRMMLDGQAVACFRQLSHYDLLSKMFDPFIPGFGESNAAENKLLRLFDQSKTTVDPVYAFAALLWYPLARHCQEGKLVWGDLKLTGMLFKQHKLTEFDPLSTYISGISLIFHFNFLVSSIDDANVTEKMSVLEGLFHESKKFEAPDLNLPMKLLNFRIKKGGEAKLNKAMKSVRKYLSNQLNKTIEPSQVSTTLASDEPNIPNIKLAPATTKKKKKKKKKKIKKQFDEIDLFLAKYDLKSTPQPDHAEMQFVLAAIYAGLEGVTNEALRLFHQAAKLGYEQAKQIKAQANNKRAVILSKLVKQGLIPASKHLQPSQPSRIRELTRVLESINNVMDEKTRKSGVDALKKVADSGDKYAQYLMAKYCITGVNQSKIKVLEKNYKEAFVWLKRSAGQGYSLAIAHLISMCEVMLAGESPGILFADHAATKFSQEVNGRLKRLCIWCFSRKDLMELPEQTEMVGFLLMAAGISQYDLKINKQMLSNGKNSDIIFLLFAVEIIERAQGKQLSLYKNLTSLKHVLGLYKSSVLLRKDLSASKELRGDLLRSLLGGLHKGVAPVADYFAAEMLIYEKQYGAGIEHCRLAAEHGNGDAQFKMGDICFGQGDIKTAIYWYERAALQADYKAQYLLARLYFLGIGVDRSMLTSAKWLKLIVEQSPEKAEAYFWLGMVALQKGEPSVAKKSFKQAAKHGLNASLSAVMSTYQSSSLKKIFKYGKKSISKTLSNGQACGLLELLTDGQQQAAGSSVNCIGAIKGFNFSSWFPVESRRGGVGFFWGGSDDLFSCHALVPKRLEKRAAVCLMDNDHLSASVNLQLAMQQGSLTAKISYAKLFLENSVFLNSAYLESMLLQMSLDGDALAYRVLTKHLADMERLPELNNTISLLGEPKLGIALLKRICGIESASKSGLGVFNCYFSAAIDSCFLDEASGWSSPTACFIRGVYFLLLGESHFDKAMVFFDKVAKSLLSKTSLYERYKVVSQARQIASKMTEYSGGFSEAQYHPPHLEEIPAAQLKGWLKAVLTMFVGNNKVDRGLVIGVVKECLKSECGPSEQHCHPEHGEGSTEIYRGDPSLRSAMTGGSG